MKTFMVQILYCKYDFVHIGTHKLRGARKLL